jgi:hypothetical protein
VYEWLLFMHVALVLAFMLLHGVQVTVTWIKRFEADPEQNLGLFAALPSVLPLRITMVTLIVSGFLLVAWLNIWTKGWIWLSLLLLVLLWLSMWRWGGGYYGALSLTADAAISARGTSDEAAARAAFNAVRLSWHAPGLTVIGVVGTLVILWLMVFRPF